MGSRATCRMCNGKGFILCYGSDCLVEGNDQEMRACPACHGRGALEPWRQTPHASPELWTWVRDVDPMDPMATWDGF
jgi:hypothetical protein